MRGPALRLTTSTTFFTTTSLALFFSTTVSTTFWVALSLPCQQALLPRVSSRARTLCHWLCPGLRLACRTPCRIQWARMICIDWISFFRASLVVGHHISAASLRHNWLFDNDRLAWLGACCGSSLLVRSGRCADSKGDRAALSGQVSYWCCGCWLGCWPG